MIIQMYFTNLKDAIKGAKKNGVSCYYDIETDTKTWYKKNDYLEIVYFES